MQSYQKQIIEIMIMKIRAFSGMDHEKQTGQKEYKMEVVQVVLL